MSCKHLIWNCYCKEKQEFCERSLFPRLCEDYCREDEVEDLKKIINKGPIMKMNDNNCKCEAVSKENLKLYKSEEDYVTLLENFINTLYVNKETCNWGFFNMSPEQAEKVVSDEMNYLGFEEEDTRRVCDYVCDNFKTNYEAIKMRLHSFCSKMIMNNKKYPSEFRFVLTLILGYLDKLDSIAIIDCDDPRSYFKDKVSEVPLSNLKDAVNKTRLYVEASNDNKLAEGMRKVEAWFEELQKENIPPKELTIADIEKQLGYKIKIVGDKN